MSVIRVNMLIVRIIPPKNSGNIMQSEYLSDSAIALNFEICGTQKQGRSTVPALFPTRDPESL